MERKGGVAVVVDSFQQFTATSLEKKIINLVAHNIKRAHTKSTKNHTKQKIYNQ
jgi:hypothetical protein